MSLAWFHSSNSITTLPSEHVYRCGLVFLEGAMYGEACTWLVDKGEEFVLC